MLRIFYMDDCEWWIGDATEAEMIAAFQEEYGEREGMEDEVYALSDDLLDSTPFYYDENDLSLTRTFREQLALEDHNDPTPRFFAGTEW
ncbi:MAG: hypothetical protein GAK38_02946 [Xylophilus sp.]|nr:MAG: hypothetical protein GAK38_02946 [Xylophilus sp.]